MTKHFKPFLALAIIAFASQAWSQANQSADIDSQIEALRSDVRADKTKIIGDAMRFTPKESEAFWPIYKQYEAASSKLNDERVNLIKEYAEKFTTLTDSDAKTMSKKAFDLESRNADLKREFFDEFNKKLPATTVAKFFQLEHRLDLLLDLHLASELPSLLVKPSTGVQPAAQK
jgi:hypothetical protein